MKEKTHLAFDDAVESETKVLYPATNETHEYIRVGMVERTVDIRDNLLNSININTLPSLSNQQRTW